MLHFASKRMPCVVGWNHLIDYYMNKNTPNKAWTAYNDVSELLPTPKGPIADIRTSDEEARAVSRFVYIHYILPRAGQQRLPDAKRA